MRLPNLAEAVLTDAVLVTGSHAKAASGLRSTATAGGCSLLLPLVLSILICFFLCPLTLQLTSLPAVSLSEPAVVPAMLTYDLLPDNTP